MKLVCNRSPSPSDDFVLGDVRPLSYDRDLTADLGDIEQESGLVLVLAFNSGVEEIQMRKSL
jgi:hypothetical protein